VRGTQTGTGTIEYATSRGLGIGTLFDDAPTQLLVGDIAEVLIYSDISPERNAMIQRYIETKYFQPSTPVRIQLQSSGGTTTVSWPLWWRLQSAENITGPWTDVVGATSPYAVNPNGSQQFFRLAQ